MTTPHEKKPPPQLFICRYFEIPLRMDKAQGIPREPYFNTYIEHIDPYFWRELCCEGKLLHFEKGEEFVSIGRAGQWIGYIRSGTMKYVVYSDDGVEHVVGMEHDGEFVADFPLSLYGKASKISIVAVTPSDVYCYSVRDLMQRMEEDPEIRERVMHATEALFSTLYDRYLALYSKTPQQRYDELIRSHSDIFKWFSLKDIASYLNVTPTYLSLLRKKSKIRK